MDRGEAMIDADEIPPKRIIALKRQLQTANARLIAIERERRELKESMAALDAQLKKEKGGPKAAP
jgi:hypothetical protein